MKKGQLNVDYKGRRIAFNNSEKLVGQAVRYTTIDYAAVVSYAAKAANLNRALKWRWRPYSTP